MAKQKTRFIPADNSADIINLILDPADWQPKRGVYTMVRTDSGVVRRERRGEYQVGRVYLLRKRVGD